MAQLTGPLTTFSSTVGLKLDLSDMLPYVTDPSDTPFYTAVNKKAPTVSASKHEWLEEGLPASSDALSSSMADTTTASFVATDYTKFKKGYVIKIESELLRVSATPQSTTVSATRGYAGSTAATHTTPLTVDIVAYAVTDGADPEPFTTTDRVNKFNYHSMFQELIEVTELDEWIQIYGVQDKFAHEVAKWLKALAIRSEKALLYSRRNEDTTNKTRTMGGLDYYIATNITDESAAAQTETKINTMLNTIYTTGADVNDITFFASPKQKRAFSALIAASQRYYPRPTSAETAGVSVDTYISDFGMNDIKMDRWVPADVVYYVNMPLAAVVQGQPFTLENLAKTGTSRKSQIVGWFSFELKAENRSGKQKNLA